MTRRTAPIPLLREHVAEAVVALLTLGAFLLRISQLHQSLVGDEVFTYQDIIGHSFRSVLNTVHTGGENSPPLFFLLAWVCTKLGDPSVWIRVPSLLLGTATVPVVYALGRATIGRLAGLIAAAIIAVTPFAVYYGIEARPYATMTFFVAVSTLALLRAVKTRSRWWWLVYVLGSAAAAYTHYTSIFVLAVQALWALWTCRDRLREPLIANGLIALLYLPWLPHLRGKALAVIGDLYPLGVKRVLTDLLRPIPGHPGAPLRAIPTIVGLLAIAIVVLAGLAAGLASWLRRGSSGGRPKPRATAILLVLLAGATPVGLLLYSLLVTDLWLPRGLSASMPATALVIGAALTWLPRRLRIVAVAVTLVILIAGTLRSFDAVYARGPFRTIAEYLDRVAGPRDPVAIVSLTGAPAIPAQFQKPHLVVPNTDVIWRLVPVNGSAYIVLDDTIARALKIPAPHPSGFQLVSRQHYAGAFETDLLTYRRQQ